MDTESARNKASWSPVSWDPWGTQRAPSPSSTSETTSDSLPSLTGLDLSYLDDDDDSDIESIDDENQSDTSVEETAKVVNSQAPPPPPPPMATLATRERMSLTKIRLMRGSNANRLIAIVDDNVLTVDNNSFPISIDRIEHIYQESWPEATTREVRQAAIMIDDILARKGNLPAMRRSLLMPMAALTTYRDGVGMTKGERAMWAEIENEDVTDSHIDIACKAINPTHTNICLL